MVPNLTLIEVCIMLLFFVRFWTKRRDATSARLPFPGEEVRRVATEGSQGGYVEGGRGEAQKDVHGPRRDGHARVSRAPLHAIEGMSLGIRVMSASYILH